ncbi:hypothetical protein [Hymenobacter sp. B81]|uniref:hypothetical protein n=1 Tax=Hymenobacter sp. B81 TaxID=3344878 RepID=UPI0037DCBE23
MKLLALVVFALLAWSRPVAAQAPAAALAAYRASLEARVQQYYADLARRLREAYFASSDGRAIALLSTAVDEFGARRRALRQELGQLRPPLATAPDADWTREQQAVLSSPAAVKMAERAARNPALETALNRFNAAQLEVLVPTEQP